MHSRAALASIVVFVGGLASGCRGEFGFDETDGAETGETDGGEGENLLGNPGFELWNDEQLALWESDAATITRSQETVEGDSSAIVAGDSYASVGQDLNFPQALPVGTCVVASAAIRWVEGPGTAPAFLFTATYDDQTEELLGDAMTWIADGQWHESAIAPVALPRPTTRLRVNIGNTVPSPHAFGIDDASIQVVACP